MNSSDDKIIGGDSSGISGSEKIIGGQSGRKIDNEKILLSNGFLGTGSDIKAESPIVEKESTAKLISDSTREKGLKVIPADFENKNGSWTSINSSNPFEQLYLDYEQYESISDQVVQANYEILSTFWKDKFLLLNGVTRERIRARYGEAVVNQAEKNLDLALQRLKTPAGRQLYFLEIDKERLRNGIEAIKGFLEIAITDGIFTAGSARILITKGTGSGLTSLEVENYILAILEENDFKPRPAKSSVDPFKNQWMTDGAYQELEKKRAPEVEWLGEKATTLYELGLITYKIKPLSEIFQRSISFLPTLVSNLEGSATIAIEFQKIIEEEKDYEKKYLKVLYHLDPTLPFRFKGEEYTNIETLLDVACKESDSFQAIIELFIKDHLDIWLNESAPDKAKLLSGNKTHLGFLRFLYDINWKYPFYLGSKKYETLEMLIEEAKVNQSIWVPISQYMENGYLPTWFVALGKSDINSNYNAGLEKIISSGLYHNNEIRLGAVQTLIMTIDRTVDNPQIIASVHEIKKRDIEGKGITQLTVKFNLNNFGFAKAAVKLDTLIEGITLNKNEIFFNHIAGGNNENEVLILIDSSKLIKDQIYNLKMMVSSVYETINIPVELKVIFPKKAYLTKLILYSVISACYFGVFRYLLGIFVNYKGWLINNPQTGSANDAIGNSPLLSFFVFALFVLGGIFSFKLIKKIEKIDI